MGHGLALGLSEGLVLAQIDNEIRTPMSPDQVRLIRVALERVVASDVFRNAPQLGKFLRFVVEATLEGRAAELKGYTIATQAFGRPTDFDPQIDPIVRVEAMRLRRALDTYYAGSGIYDQLRIAIPRGGYVPHFLIGYPGASEPELVQSVIDEPAPERRSARMAAAAMLFLALLGAVLVTALLSPGGPTVHHTIVRSGAGTLPTVLLEPIIVEEAASDRFSERRFRVAVSDALARFDEVRVIDRRTRGPGAQHFGFEKGIYSLSVFVSPAQDDVEISVQLLARPMNRIVWSRRFIQTADASERDVASTIAALVAQPSGVLFADLRSLGNAERVIECHLQTFDYWAKPLPETHRRARSCLERLAVTHPNLAGGRALLSLMYLDEYRSGYNRRDAPLKRALAAAKHALRLNPESARGHQALMEALLVSGENEAALEAGARAALLNPNDSEILASFGAALIAAGNYAAGAERLRQARRMAPGLPARYEFFLFLAEYMGGESETAAKAALRAEGDGHALDLLGRAILAAEAGNALHIAELVRALSIVEADFVADPERALERRGMNAQIVERLVQGFQDAQSGVSLTVEAN